MLSIRHNPEHPADAHRSVGSLLRLCRRLDLSLSGSDLVRLIFAHSEALENTGRIEFEPCTLEMLLCAFHDSPYMLPGEAASTLCELIDLFYRLKNETRDRIPDDDLLLCMRHFFDGACAGSVLMLSDMLERSLS